jgi:hypothetical protein
LSGGDKVSGFPLWIITRWRSVQTILLKEQNPFYVGTYILLTPLWLGSIGLEKT